MKKIKSWKTQFATVYAGQAFSLLGSAAVQFAVIWWLTIQTESAIVLTISTIVAMLPNMLIGPFAGVWVDRYNRRTVMILADALVALSSVVLAIAFLMVETPPIWFICIILFVRGLGNTFHGPAMQAAIPTLVPTEMLTKAGGWGNLVNSSCTMLGPVLGAALMAIAPIASIMLVDILGAAFAIICLLFVKIPDIPQSEEKVHMLRDMKLGFRAIKKNKPLMAMLLPILMLNILYMPLGSLFPLLVRTHFLGDAWHSSITELVFSGGLLVSSLIVGVTGGMKKRFLQVAIAMALLGITSLISGILPATILGFWMFVVLCFFMGGTGTFLNVPFFAYIQESTEPEVMGKVFSLLMTGMMMAMPIGLLVAGPVSEIIGVDKWFLYSGIGLFLTGIWFRISTKRYDKETMLPEVKEEQTE